MRMGKEKPLKAQAVLLQFNAVWIRAIAWSWEDEQFKQRLLRNPKEVFEKELHFPLENEDVRVQVKEIQPGEKNPYTGEVMRYQKLGPDTPDDPWASLREHEITLFLPPPPEDPVDRGVAIADYAETGRVYPFTSA